MTQRKTTTPQEQRHTPDAVPGDARPRRGSTGPANQGSPAARVMKQFAKTAAERGEGAPTGAKRGGSR